MIASPTPASEPRPLAAVLRPRLRDSTNLAAILLPDLPALRPAAARRMARALLEDAARSGGGAVFRTLAGAELLCGTARPAAIRAAGALSRLLDGALAPPIWRLPEESADLLAWASPEYHVPDPGPPDRAWPDPGGFQARLDRVAAEQVVQPRPLRDAAGAPAGRQLVLQTARMLTALGLAEADAELVAYAEDRLARRLLPGLGAWAATGEGLRLIPLPQHRLPPPATAPGATAVVPLARAGWPGLGEQRQQLHRRGWQLAIAGLDSVALRALQPLALPADILLLSWSPALAEQALPEGAPRARLFLDGADAAGRAWAAGIGIGLIEMPA